jgi:hypothetical protein
MLDGVPILGIGQSGLIALVVLFVLTDRLVWHKRLDELKKQLDAKDEQLSEALKQNSLLMGSAVPATNAVMNALHKALENEET